MLPGLVVGVSATVEDTVQPNMQAEFGDQVIHSVYGTAAMVYHMEWAARRVITPYLEAHEEGIGTGVEVRHLHPAPIGASIVARAVCIEVDGEHVVCDVDVRHGGRLLGEGRVKQRIIPKAMLHERFPEMWGSIESVSD
jgi:fluoroacetyl-CoA thioesterase